MSRGAFDTLRPNFDKVFVLMLQFIREKSQGVIATVILGILVLCFALWGVHNYFYGNGQQATVVSVNGSKITSQDFQAAVQRAQAQAQHMGYAINTQDQLKAFKKTVLQQLVMMQLLHQSAESNGFGVSPTLLELTLAKLPVFQENGQFSKARFSEVISGMGYSQDQFLGVLSNNLMLQQVQNGIMENAFSLPYMADRAMHLIHQSRDLSYALVSAQPFEASVKVTQKQAMQYYRDHQDAFTTPEKVSVDYIQVSLDAIEKNLHPTEQQLQAFYQNNVGLFSVPAQWKVSRIVIPLSPEASDQEIAKQKSLADSVIAELKKDPTKFDALAKQYPASDSLGHDGWVNLMEVPQPMQQALMNLKKPGQLSDVITTPNGLQIIQLVTSKPAKVHPFDSVKSRVEKVYLQQTAQKTFSTQVDRLSNITFEHPDSLQPAAKALGLTVQHTPYFTQQGDASQKGLLSNPRVLSAAFSSDVLTNGNNSDLISLDDTTSMVLRVNQKVPAKLKPFSEVSTQIHQILTHDAAVKAANLAAGNLLGAATNAASLKAAADKTHARFHSLNNVNRNARENGVSPLILETAFAMPSPYQSHYPRKLVQLPNGDSAVVLVTGVQNPDKKYAKGVQASFEKAAMANAGQRDYALYMNGLKSNAKIKYYSQADS